MQSQRSKIVLSWAAVILWMIVIYYFSNQPDLKSSLPTIWDTVFRKIAHMAEFFVLAYLVFRAVIINKISLHKAVVISLIVAVSYAFFDEWHQTWVIGRTGSIIDVGIDTVGVIVFYGLAKFNKHESLPNQ